jgi:hypothetical protein
MRPMKNEEREGASIVTLIPKAPIYYTPHDGVPI